MTNDGVNVIKWYSFALWQLEKYIGQLRPGRQSKEIVNAFKNLYLIAVLSHPRLMSWVGKNGDKKSYGLFSKP